MSFLSHKLSKQRSCVRKNNNNNNNIIMSKEFVITIGPLTLQQAASIGQTCEAEDLDFDIRLVEEKKKIDVVKKRVVSRVGRVTADHVIEANAMIRRGKSDKQIAKAIGIGKSTANAIRNGRYDELVEDAKHTAKRSHKRLRAEEVRAIKSLYKEEGLEIDQIAQSTGYGKETVRRCLIGDRDDLLDPSEQTGDIYERRR